MFIITKQYIINSAPCELSLERMIWAFLIDACATQQCKMENLLHRIDACRGNEKLSEAMRLFALLYAKEKYDFNPSALESFLGKDDVE